jgi:hypothetical protein
MFCDETVLVLSTNVHRPQFGAVPICSSEFMPAADKFRNDSANERIVARGLEYSVSHFIDCNPVARRLWASPIGLVIEQTRKNYEHEYDQT